MAKNLQKPRSFLRRHVTSLFIAMILVLSGFIPFLYHYQPATETPGGMTPPLAENLTFPVINLNTVAGESNFTRESYPFILDNYPQFNWKNPGCFNGSQSSAGAILVGPTATVRGWDRRLATNPLTCPGAGSEKYPNIYNSISGLNESNIRIMYLDSNYNWISIPYQIDMRGWVNIWYPADLNKFAGMAANGAGRSDQTVGTGSVFSQGGGEHIQADATVGLGWIAGDLVTSEGWTNYGPTKDGHTGVNWPGSLGANDMLLEWYRIPIFTYISPRQPDGSITSKMLKIDPQYRDNLVWCYMSNKTTNPQTGFPYRPHTAWLNGDTGGSSAFTNAWNAQPGTPAGGYTCRNCYPAYANMSRNGWRPAFVNTTNGLDPKIEFNSSTFCRTNMVFMGDTWFTTPGNYTTTAGGYPMPNWVKTAYPFKLIDGAVDKAAQICFYVYNGRRAPDWYWWNYTYFPQRFELKIRDPIDGGQTWMYLYFNNATAWNPLKGGKNLGAPAFTTTDSDGNPIKSYISWDPATNAVTSDFYRVTFDPATPFLVNSLRLFGNTDGQSILSSFNKMYIYGNATMAQGTNQACNKKFAFAREGVWQGYNTTVKGFTDLVTVIENPSVAYPNISRDLNQLQSYLYPPFLTGKRGTYGNNWSAPSCPQHYYGLGACLQNKSRMGLYKWAMKYGDQRAIANGPCRVVFYVQGFMHINMSLMVTVSGTDILYDQVDLIMPMMDGPLYYYRRMEVGPPTSVEIPDLAGATIRIYYAYINCGNLNTAIRNDFNVTAAQEWTGGADRIDNGYPKFGWNEQYGYKKVGGLPLQTSGCNLLGYSVFNPGINPATGTPYNQTNYYKSGGNPIRNAPPYGTIQANREAIPPPYGGTGNNLNVPDWAMVTSETHGGVWLYIPKREANESLDNNGRAGRYGSMRMYFRDDIYQPEFGICLAGSYLAGTTYNPCDAWIRGGTTTSEYHLMMVFGDWKPKDALEVGHKLYCSYYWPVEALANFTVQTQGPRFIFQTTQPDKLIYKNGQKVNLLVTGGTPMRFSTNSSGIYTKNATIYVNTRNINPADPILKMTNRGDGSWNFTYTIGTVSLPYTRYINLTAKVPGTLWTTNSTYSLSITIDNVPPTPGQLAMLNTTTRAASVLLDWSASPGSDVGCASMANPSGLGWYRLKRWNVSWAVDGTILADNIPITTMQFLDSFVQDGKKYNYNLSTYDEVGNVIDGATRSTFISLPFIPAQPVDLAPTQKTGSGILIDWTQNPGSGATITGYRVYVSNYLAGPYSDASGLLASTVKTYTYPSGSLTEAKFYYFKVLTIASVGLLSAPVYTRIDNVAPAPAELATPLPIYKSQTAEIILSWAIDVLPEYQTGGFPGQDLNGIDHWTLYKRINPGGAWKFLANVPYAELSEDQRYLDTAVVNGGNYSYAIKTFDAAGNSALCAVNKTTKLSVIGPGIAEIYSVVPGSGDVKQGQVFVPVTVMVRNPGMAQITLNQVYLYLHTWNVSKEINVTLNYQGFRKLDGTVLYQYQNRTFIFYVNVSVTAMLGTITVDAQAIYNNTKKSAFALSPSSWVVTPDAELIIQTITSGVSVVYPGKRDIPVTVNVKNPGKSDAIIQTIQLTFKQGALDVSGDYLVECITSLPTTGFNSGVKSITLNVSVGISATTGGVTIDAIVTGSASGVPMSDSGATTPLVWAVQTSAKPVIASIVADKPVYWSQSTLTLTVTCDKKYHLVKADLTPLDNSGWTTPVNSSTPVYLITKTLGTVVGAGTYLVKVNALNGSGNVNQTIPIRLGQAPTFSGWVQNPSGASIRYDQTVNITIRISDDVSNQTVSAYLKYNVEGGDWNIRPMTHTAHNLYSRWTVLIPTQQDGGLLTYTINATDAEGNWNLFTSTYTVTRPEPKPYITAESTHNQANTVQYTTIPGQGAPLNQWVYYTATIDTSQMGPVGKNYTVIVQCTDPAHRAVPPAINYTVYLLKPNVVSVTLRLEFLTALGFTTGTIITGYMYICTGLPKTGGETIASFYFQHLIE